MSSTMSDWVKRYDLHSHTIASDGRLSPQELIDRACDKKIHVLAITDHDTTAALPCAQAYIDEHQLPLQLITGVEISTKWENKEIHIVGLNFDLYSPQLMQLLSEQSVRRRERAQAIGVRLQKAGIPDAWQNAMRLAQGGQVTRAHFAQYLVDSGVEKSMGNVFKNYLVRGKTGYVPSCWCSIDDAVDAIHHAGGHAVIAHPGRYGLSNKWLKKLVAYFQQCGGDAIEVASCQQSANERQYLGKLAQEYELCLSQGSDFHFPCSWIELGRNLWLPSGGIPIWERW